MPRYEVKFTLGTRVRVTGPGADDCFDEGSVGQVGRIIAIWCDDYGSSPDDPYLEIEFDTPYVHEYGLVATDMFWPEELELIEEAK